jgi:hypothetical protein
MRGGFRLTKAAGGTQSGQRTVIVLNRKHSNGSGARVQGIEEFPVALRSNVNPTTLPLPAFAANSHA